MNKKQTLESMDKQIAMGDELWSQGDYNAGGAYYIRAIARGIQFLVKNMEV